jgi:hypothetical protein
MPWFVTSCLALRSKAHTASQRRKGDVTGCQFGALGACPVVPGGCPHPTGWWRHPNHRRLPREVPRTRDLTTARDIWSLCGMREARGRSPPPATTGPPRPAQQPPVAPPCAAGGAPSAVRGIPAEAVGY